MISVTEFLKSRRFVSDPLSEDDKYLIEVITDYANLIIETAANEAKANHGYKSDEWGMNTYLSSWVDKESILKLKELIK